MTSTTQKTPTIGRIPAEIHHRALTLGLVAETWTEEVSGHGVTGRVGWAISAIHVTEPWTDAVRLRTGTDSTHEHARASLRDALDEIERKQS